MRANYSNLQKGVHETSVFLEKFLGNLLMGEDNELKNRYLHIDWQEKTAFSHQKQPIEQPFESKHDLLKILETAKVTSKTKNNIVKLYEAFGMETIFGRSDVLKILSITERPATELLKKMQNIGVTESVRGLGKGKYRFVVRDV